MGDLKKTYVVAIEAGCGPSFGKVSPKPHPGRARSGSVRRNSLLPPEAILPLFLPKGLPVPRPALAAIRRKLGPTEPDQPYRLWFLFFFISTFNFQLSTFTPTR